MKRYSTQLVAGLIVMACMASPAWAEEKGEVACCLPDDQCVMAPEQQCLEVGGTIVPICLGDNNQDGADDACKPASDFEACCLDDGMCVMLPYGECEGQGYVVPQCLGDANGDQIDDACQNLEEACCLEDGQCVIIPPNECEASGGYLVPQCLGDSNGDQIDDACQNLEEACCLPDGQCAYITPAECRAAGGYQVAQCLGDGNNNGVDDACEPDEEDCCFDDGTCGPVPVGQCPGQVVTACLGDNNGNNIDDACEDPTEEGCCLQDGTCVWVMADECIDMGGYVVPACLGDANGNNIDDACENQTDYILNFSIDIGSDTELSDPFWDQDEVFDPGDIYVWSQAPLPVGGVDGTFFDDAFTFAGVDPWPDTPDPAVPPATRVPVGTVFGPWEEFYHQYFDLDGHDNIELDLREMIPHHPIEVPIILEESDCIHLGKHVFISFDDDKAPGWIQAPMGDVPVTSPSPIGTIYGTSTRNDEVVGLTVAASGPPAYPIVNQYPVASEMMVHVSMAPNPDASEEDDDDVDSLDILNRDYCQYLYFTADHEATFADLQGVPLDPGDIYLATNFGPIRVIDEWIHLGVQEDADIDAFEFVRFQVDEGAPLYFGILFSVDEDDPLTPMDESGGLDPRMIYASFFNGMHVPFLHEPLEDDIDAIMCWKDELPPAGGEDKFDWGDAPDGPYPTLAPNGANHLIVNGVFMGNLIDDELNGQPTPMADGDDLANLPDEDGVIFANFVQGRTATVTVTASTAGYFNLWIDLNQNGTWAEATDWVVVDAAIPAGTSTFSLPIGFHTPSGATFARARFCTQPGLSFAGGAPDGEVEDYRIFIEPWWTIPVDVIRVDSIAFHGPVEGNLGIQVFPPQIVFGAPYDCEPRYGLPQYQLDVLLSSPIPNAAGITVVASDSNGNVHNGAVTLGGGGTIVTAIFAGADKLNDQTIYQVTVSGVGVNAMVFQYVVLVGNVVNLAPMHTVNSTDRVILNTKLGFAPSVVGAQYDIFSLGVSQGVIDSTDRTILNTKLGNVAN